MHQWGAFGFPCVRITDMKLTTSFDPEIAQKVGLLEAIVHSWLFDQATLMQKKTGSERPAIEVDTEYFKKVFEFAHPDHVTRAIKRLIDARYVTPVDNFLEVEAEKKKPVRRKKGDIVVPEDVKLITYVRSDGNGADEVVEATIGRVVNDMIDMFRFVNPGYQEFFKQPRFRKAFQRMIEAEEGYGVATIFEMLRVLPQTNNMQFAPVITNPGEFERNAPKLMAFIQREKSKLDNGFRITVD